MAGQWSAEKMRALGSRHAQLEAECDLDGVMATLVADPIYEFWPIGLRARGQDAIRPFIRPLIDMLKAN